MAAVTTAQRHSQGQTVQTEDAIPSTEVLRAVAWDAVMSMPVRQRTVFALAISQRLSYRQIAQRLDTTEDAVKRDIRDGLGSLHLELTAKGSELGLG